MIAISRLLIRPALVALLFGVSTLAAVGGQYKCWTNEEGVRECGQSVPPEYAQQRIEILNDQGVVIKVEEPAKTPEQLEAEKHAAEQRALEQQREAEQRQQDQILLDTFTNERDLKLYYEDRADAIQGLIDLTRSSNQSLQEKLNQLQKRAANLERRGKPLSDSLLEEMEQVKRQRRLNKKFIAEQQQELDKLNAKYGAQLERFRKLKSAGSH